MVTTTGLFQELRLHTGCTAPRGRGCWGGGGRGTRYLLPAGEEMDVGEGQGQPGPRGQLGTVLAGESWLPTTLEAFAVAALAPTGPCTAHLHPLASTSLLLLRAWLPGFTAPPQSNPPQHSDSSPSQFPPTPEQPQAHHQPPVASLPVCLRPNPASLHFLYAFLPPGNCHPLFPPQPPSPQI